MTVLRPAPLEPFVVQQLQAAFGSRARVGTRIPETRPAAFLRVTRSGGDMRNRAQEYASVLVECYAATPPLAEALAGDAWAILNAWNDDPPVPWLHRSEPMMPVNFPDPDTTTHHRYQFLTQLTANLEVSP